VVHEEHIENVLDLVRRLVENGDVGQAAALLTNRHPADQADLLEELEEDVRDLLARALSSEQLGDILEYLDDEVRSRLLRDLSPESLAPILNELDEDIAVDIVQDLPQETAEGVVPLLEWREDVEELLAYPEQSAGGRMSTEWIALRREWTVEESLWYLRRQPLDPDQPFYVYVVDRLERLIGIVSLRALITAAPFVEIGSIMTESVIDVRVDEDQEAAAERMRHYNLLALPVVDGEGHLRGVITADNILDVQVEEATEDMFRLAGLPEEERIFRPIRQALPPRLGWLLFNMSTAFVGAAVVSAFEGTIERVAALAIFMPMVAGMAGNAGLQTLTLVVRSIALGEVEPRDGLRVIRHEIVLAVLNGLVIGLLVGGIAWVWQGSAWLGLIVAAALLANIANTVFIGSVVPMTLKRMNVDPALASGVIVTFSDAMGFGLFLGLATLLISRLA
jgi:magnesium transporter